MNLDGISNLDTYKKFFDFNQKPYYKVLFKYSGFNKEIMNDYYWIVNFAYLRARGWTPLKLEEHQYYSETSQFGQNQRQVKGGAIKAFQENMQQLIQLVKVHLLGLLDEIKKADFYYRWMIQIESNDKILVDIVEKYNKIVKVKKNKEYSLNDVLLYLKENNDRKISGKNYLDLKEIINLRNEAISHMKDKWVNEVEGGRLWQMEKSTKEQGLDFTLLPNLFFGINLENPLYELHKKGKSLKKQLDEDIYEIDITKAAQEQVGRQFFKFYTWLPTAINDTKITFKLKISALKQFYSQIQVQIEFIKPLLIEINSKKEGFEKESFFSDYASENPDIVNIFDSSYSYLKLMHVYQLTKTFTLRDFDFTRFGLFIKKNSKSIIYGPHEGESGFIHPEEIEINGEIKYRFYQVTCENPNEFHQEEWDKVEEEWEKMRKEKKWDQIFISKDHLQKFAGVEFNFKQNRRNIIEQTNQGQTQKPYMHNEIGIKSYVFDIVDFAKYRAKLKVDNLEMIGTFIKEIEVIKKDLLEYIYRFEGRVKSESEIKKENNEIKKEIKRGENGNTFMGEFFAKREKKREDLILKQAKNDVKNKSIETLIGEAEKLEKSQTKPTKRQKLNKVVNDYEKAQLLAIQDSFKTYMIFKKVHGYYGKDFPN